MMLQFSTERSDLCFGFLYNGRVALKSSLSWGNVLVVLGKHLECYEQIWKVFMSLN